MDLDDELTELVVRSGDRLLRVGYQLTHDRRLRSSTEIVTDAVPEPPGAGCPEDEIAVRDQLWAALGGLSARQRAVLVLRYYEGLPDHEIAALLGCREGSVRSLASRELAVLRRRAGHARIGEEERA